MGRGFSGATLVEENAAVVGGVEVTSAVLVLVADEGIYRGSVSPIAVVNSSSRSSVKIDNGDAVRVAAFFPID